MRTDAAESQNALLADSNTCKVSSCKQQWPEWKFFGNRSDYTVGPASRLNGRYGGGERGGSLGRTSVSLRSCIDLISISHRFHSDYTWISLRLDVDFTLVLLQGHIGLTSMSPRFHIAFTSFSLRNQFAFTLTSLHLTSIPHRCYSDFTSV